MQGMFGADKGEWLEHDIFLQSPAGKWFLEVPLAALCLGPICEPYKLGKQRTWPTEYLRN